MGFVGPRPTISVIRASSGRESTTTRIKLLGNPNRLPQLYSGFSGTQIHHLCDSGSKRMKTRQASTEPKPAASATQALKYPNPHSLRFRLWSTQNDNLCDLGLKGTQTRSLGNSGISMTEIPNPSDSGFKGTYLLRLWGTASGSVQCSCEMNKKASKYFLRCLFCNYFSCVHNRKDNHSLFSRHLYKLHQKV